MSNGRMHAISRSRDSAGLAIHEIAVGDIFTLEHRFDSDDIDCFAGLCGDFSPLHVDPDFAAATEFGDRIVHGMLLASLFSTLVGMKIPGRRALYLGQELQFRSPVLVGETVTASASVSGVNAVLGIVQLNMILRKQDGTIGVNGSGRVRVRGQQEPYPEVAPMPASDLSPDTRVALVTGGSRGIGASIARRLAKDGFAVVINYRSGRAQAERVVDDIHAQSGFATAVQADVLDEEGRRSLIQSIERTFGRLDVLVNNASPGYVLKGVEELLWEDISLQFDASVRAPLELARSLFPLLRTSRGAVVNIISQVVENAPPANMLDYVLGKFGLLGLTRGLATEWAQVGVRVNGVAPSLIPTDMTSHMKDRIFKLEASRTPLKRIATASDVAGAVSYLSSPDAEFLTGVVLPVTGGQVMI